MKAWLTITDLLTLIYIFLFWKRRISSLSLSLFHPFLKITLLEGSSEDPPDLTAKQRVITDRRLLMKMDEWTILTFNCSRLKAVFKPNVPLICGSMFKCPNKSNFLIFSVSTYFQSYNWILNPFCWLHARCNIKTIEIYLYLCCLSLTTILHKIEDWFKDINAF